MKIVKVLIWTFMIIWLILYLCKTEEGFYAKRRVKCWRGGVCKDFSVAPKPPEVWWAPDPYVEEKRIAAEEAERRRREDEERRRREEEERKRREEEERKRKEAEEAERRRIQEENSKWWNIAAKGWWAHEPFEGKFANTISIGGSGYNTIITISTTDNARYEKIISDNFWSLNNGGLKQVSVKNSIECVGVGTDDNAWHCINVNQWNLIGKNVKWVSIGSDGTIWAISKDDSIWAYTGIPNVWNKVAGGLTMLSVANANNIWGVNGANDVYRWDGGGWNAVGGQKLKDVAVSASGNVVVGVAPDGSIWSWNGSKWNSIPGGLKHIACTDTYLVGVNDAGNIYKLKLTP